MKTNAYLCLMFALLITNCKGQNKEDIPAKKTAQEITIINKTFLGVTKEKNKYSVVNRCDGGYPSSKISEKILYYYYPQEGAYHTIKNISKVSDGNYKIITDGYYYFKNDVPVPENKTWFLSKKNNLIWEFLENNSDRKVLLSDSLNIINKKIEYINLPCNDEKTNIDDKANIISTKWFGKYQTTFTSDKKSKDTRDTDVIELIIKTDSVILHVERYWGEYNYLLRAIDEDKITRLIFEKIINGDETDALKKTKNFGTISFDGKKCTWVSPYLDNYYNKGNKGIYVLTKK